MEKILDKVRKLLALAESADIHEAAAAAARAQTIIDKHKVDIALLQEEEQEEEREDEAVHRCLDFPLFDCSQMPTWKWLLAWRLCEVNDCRPWTNTTYEGGEWARTVFVIGRDSDAQTIQYMHRYLVTEIDRLSKDHKGKGRTWLNNFRLGAVAEIGKRLKEKRQYDRKALKQGAEEQVQAGGDAQALVKVENALARLQERDEMVDSWMKFNKIKYSSGGSGGAHDEGAFATGRDAGAGVSLGGTSRGALGTG